MLAYFCLILAMSALFLFGAFASERARIRLGINTAKGLALQQAVIASMIWSVLTAIFAAWIWGWGVALAGLAISGLLHWPTHKLLTALLQALIDRKNATERSLP